MIRSARSDGSFSKIFLVYGEVSPSNFIGKEKNAKM